MLACVFVTEEEQVSRILGVRIVFAFVFELYWRRRVAATVHNLYRPCFAAIKPSKKRPLPARHSTHYLCTLCNHSNGTKELFAQLAALNTIVCTTPIIYIFAHEYSCVYINTGPCSKLQLAICVQLLYIT